MTTDQTLLQIVNDASPLVKLVMACLLLASIASWSIIIQRSQFYRHAMRAIRDFEQLFWSGEPLDAIYHQLSSAKYTDGLESIFVSGYREYQRLNEQGASADAIIDSSRRAMRIAEAQETEKLDAELNVLATVGSASPYVGLFGTVWGIMSSFHALGGVQQASIAMVAPGISEALIATAMGLFAAIPATIFYNRLLERADRINQYYLTFEDELLNLFNRQLRGVVA